MIIITLLYVIIGDVCIETWIIILVNNYTGLQTIIFSNECGLSIFVKMNEN